MNKSIFSINSLSKYSHLFQIVGVIGLIASLIFVGLELRQSQIIALADMQQRRIQATLDQINVNTASGLEYRRWDESSKYAAMNQLMTGMLQVEQDFYKYSIGLESEDWWAEREKYWRGGRFNICELKEVLEVSHSPSIIKDMILEGLSNGCIPVLEFYGKKNR